MAVVLIVKLLLVLELRDASSTARGEQSASRRSRSVWRRSSGSVGMLVGCVDMVVLRMGRLVTQATFRCCCVTDDN